MNRKATIALLAALPVFSASAQIGGIAPWAFPRQTLVANLPAPDGTQGLRIVTDDTDCNVATADDGVVLCLDTGAAWELVTGGGGGGTATDGDSATGFFPAGTLEHERGGLEADVSAFGGLLRIATGSTSAVSTLAGLNTALGSSIADGAHTTDTDDQTAAEVPYTPTTGTDWTDPDPTHAGGGLDALASRLTTEEAKVDDDVPEDADLGTGTPDATTFLRGDRTWAAAGGIPLRLDSDGDTVNSEVLVTDATNRVGLDVDEDGVEDFGFLAPSGFVRFILRDQRTGTNLRKWVLSLGIGDASTARLQIGLLGDAESSWTHQAEIDILHGATNEIRFGHDLRKDSDTNTGLTWSATDVVGLTAGGVLGISQGTTETTLAVEQVNSPATQACADSGDGSPGALTITVSGTSNVELTGSDVHGCAATLNEAGATRGQVLTVSNISNAGGTIDFADAAGVQETGAGCSLGLYGVAVFRYISDRWLLASCQPTN